MNNKLKKYLKLSVILLVGVAIGAGGTYYWANSVFETSHYMTLLLLNAENAEEAHYLYKNAPPEIAIYKIQRTFDEMHSFKDQGVYDKFKSDKFAVNWDSGLWQGRMGKLYKQIGKDKEASAHLNTAMGYFLAAGWKLKDEKQVLEAIKMLDIQKVSVVIKNIGEFHRRK
jgi:hypothetical protein